MELKDINEEYLLSWNKYTEYRTLSMFSNCQPVTRPEYVEVEGKSYMPIEWHIDPESSNITITLKFLPKNAEEYNLKTDYIIYTLQGK